jgi:hypothetical protein
MPLQGVDAGLKALPFHPTIEPPPPLLQTLARVEFLRLLSQQELQRLVSAGLIKHKVGHCVEGNLW